MRLPHRETRGEISFNMTPMIDVVFLLIIFFLLSSHLAKQESQMQLPLPLAATGETPPESAVRRLTLNVLEDGSLILAGRPIAGGELRERLSEAQREYPAGIEVRIRSDRRAPYRWIDPLLLACARAGIWNVTFGVYLPEDSR